MTNCFCSREFRSLHETFFPDFCEYCRLHIFRPFREFCPVVFDAICGLFCGLVACSQSKTPRFRELSGRLQTPCQLGLHLRSTPALPNSHRGYAARCAGIASAAGSVTDCLTVSQCQGPPDVASRFDCTWMKCVVCNRHASDRAFVSLCDSVCTVDCALKRIP